MALPQKKTGYQRLDEPEENYKVKCYPLPTKLAVNIISKSEDIRHLTGAFLSPQDLTFTLLQWVDVGYGFKHPKSPGIIMEMVKPGGPVPLPAKLTFFAVLALISSFNVFLTCVVKDAANKKNNETLQNIYKLFNKKEEKNAEPNENSSLSIIKILENFNKYLAKAHSDQYESFQIKIPEKDDMPIDEMLANLKIEVIGKNKKESNEELKQPPSKAQAPKTIKEKLKNSLSSVWRDYVVAIGWKKIFKPLWEMAGIVSFFYWCGFKAMSLTTGKNGGGNKWVLPALAIFIVPAIAYGAYKSYHWIKKKNGRSLKQYEEYLSFEAKADRDFFQTLETAQKQINYDYNQRLWEAENIRLKKELAALRCQPLLSLVDSDLLTKPLEEKPQAPENLNGLTDSPILQAGVGLALGTGEGHVGAQFAFWPMQGFISIGLDIVIAAGTASMFGWIIMAASVVFGVMEMVTSYREAKDNHLTIDHNQEGKKVVSLKEFEDQLAKKKTYLAELKSCIQVYMKANPGFRLELPDFLQEKKPEPKPKTTWEKVKNGITKMGLSVKNSKNLQRFGWFSFGIMVGRFAFLATYIFIPSLFVASVIFAPEVVIPLILTTALISVGLNWYKNRQREKEAHIKGLPAEDELVNKQIAQANLIADTCGLNKDLQMEQPNSKKHQLVAELALENKNDFCNALESKVKHSNEANKQEVNYSIDDNANDAPPCKDQIMRRKRTNVGTLFNDFSDYGKDIPEPRSDYVTSPATESSPITVSC